LHIIGDTHAAVVGIRLGMEERVERSVARERALVVPAALGEAWLVLRRAWSVLENLRCPRMGSVGQVLVADVLG